MKVVLVSSFPAFPATAGNRSRIRQLALAIRQLGHEVKFVLLESKYEISDDAAHEAAFGSGNYIKLPKRNWRRKWLRELLLGVSKRIVQLAGIEAGYYSRLDRFRDRDFLRQLADLDLRPDAVVVEYVLDSWAFDAFPRTARRVLDAHDAFAERHKEYVARGIRNYWVSFRPHDENDGFRRADVVLAIQQEEARRFNGQLAADARERNPEVSVVSHLLDVDPVEASYDAGDTAVFLASDNPSNRHAIHSFLKNVLPRVVHEIPAFDLKLAGSICGAVPDQQNVTKLGWVDDVKAVFARAPLSINPMLAGTGIAIKLLDAMACGVPSVCTATGVRGVPETMREGVRVVADEDAPGFAAAMVRLARDADLRRAMGRAAREDAMRWNALQMSALSRSLGGA